MSGSIHFRKTLYFRIFLLIAVLGITFFSGIYFIYRLSLSRFEQELLYHSDTLTSQICHNVDVSLNELSKKTVPLTLTNERFGPLLQDRRSSFPGIRIQVCLEEFLSMNYDIYWMAIIDSSSNVYMARRDSRSSSMVPSLNRIRDLYHDNLAALSNRAGNTIWLAGEQDDGIILMRLIFDADTMQFCGALAAEVENSSLKAIFQDVDSTKSGTFFLYDANGALIFSTAAGPEKITEKMHSQNYLYKEYPINRGKLNLALIVDLKAKNQRFSDLLALISGIGVFVFVIIIMSLWLMFGRTAKNLKILLENIDRISEGDFDVKATSFSRCDELDILALRIQQMSGRIKLLMNQVVREKEIQQLNEYRLLDARYQALQAQVNPHFLFNVLQSINGIAQINGDMQVSRLIGMLAKLFRGSIDRHRSSCELKEELDYVKNYLQLYQAMYPDRFEIVWEIDPALLDTRVPTHILQPIVENSLVHGIEPTVSNCTVRVSVQQEQGCLYIRVWDNGAGIPVKKLNSILADLPGSRRIGLKNVQDRIQLLYGKEYGIALSSEIKQFTEVTLILPLP